MAKRSMISWCTSTWNPWIGCTKISPGCLNCYMYRAQERFGKDPSKITRSKTQFTAPLKWKTPSVVFVCSWSDFFHEAADRWRQDVWRIMNDCRRHQFLILTKRPENIKHALPDDWGVGYPNVWLGVTVETETYLYRIDILDETPCAHRFVSYEPALECFDFYNLTKGFDWFICGGESGPDSRPADPGCFKLAKTTCENDGLPFFFKQHGGNKMINGVWGGNKLDGRVYQSIPEPLKEIFAFHKKHPSCP